MSKRAISLFLSILLLLTLSQSVVFAQSETQLRVSSATANVGETISIDVSATGNPEIIACAFGLVYDKNYLQPTKLDSKLTGTSQHNINNTSGENGMVSYVFISVPIVKVADKICTVQFTVLKKPENGVTAIKLVKLDNNEILSGEHTEINANIVNGAVTVAAEGPIIAVTNIKLNKSTLTLGVEKSETLLATILPENASNKGVHWTTSDANIAVVNNGEVFAKNAGTAMITAKSIDGNKTATCTLTVTSDSSGGGTGGGGGGGGGGAVAPPTTPEVTPPAVGVTITLKQNAKNLNYMSGYEDHTFRPDQTMIRAETAVLLSRLVDSTGEIPKSNFTDLESFGWAQDAIDLFYAAGVFSGYDDNTFRPEQGIRRGEFSTMLVRMLKLENEPQGETKFSDTKGHWAEKNINIMSNKGYITGYGNDMFGPNDLMTRAQCVVLINRILGIEESTEDSGKFTDLDNSHWAAGAIHAVSK